VASGERPALWWATLSTAAILCFIAFFAQGGLSLGRMTTVEIALTIASGAVVAGAVLLAPQRRGTQTGGPAKGTPRPAYGVWPAGLLLALSALTALSVVWSVQPDASWQDAGRMFAFSGVFAAAVALSRATPSRWPSVLGGVVLASVAVCAYALLTKVFPNHFDANDIYARLRAPYGYWNAIGLTAALGVICCLWLGARRAGHALLNALAYPAMGVMLVTLLLAYSRGALVALAVGLALWFGAVPLRLRGAAVLVVGALAAAPIVAWDFSTHVLSTDRVPLAARTTAGHQLGALLAAMVVLLAVVGVAIGFYTGRRAPSPSARRRAGAVLVALLSLAVIGFGGALAASHRGFTGSISHAFHTLTDPHAPVPPNTPDRLTAIGSVRARYWNEALKVFQAHPALGAGAAGYQTARLRYRTETLEVKHAHGFLVQTLADLGLVGLVITLALLLTWMADAGRPTHPFNRRWTSWRELRARRRGRGSGGWRRIGWHRAPVPYTAERIGLLSMLCLVVAFAVHSLVDWTWYVPADACVALLFAGWLAGRGPLRAAPATAGEDRAAGSSAAAGVGRVPAGAPRPEEVEPSGTSRSPSRGELKARLTDPRSALMAAAVVLAALLAAWAEWQPERSAQASQTALTMLARDPRGAEAAAQAAVAHDELSAQALFTLATVQRARGQPALARATLQRAVRLQPANPHTWLTLGEYDLASDPRLAAMELGAAIYLNPESVAPAAIAAGNPESITLQNDYVEALRASGPPQPAPTTAPNPAVRR
jgi:hypothetical protein